MRVRIVSVCLLAALLVSACAAASSTTFEPLSAERPYAQLAEGLAISANPATLTGEFGVQLRAETLEALTAGQATDAVAQAAFAARPASLVQRSALFTLQPQGTPPGELFISVIAQGGANAEALDVYAWDGQTWRFLPSQARGGQRVASVSQLPQAVALFEAAPSAPLTMIRFNPGDVWPLNVNTSGSQVLLGGVVVQPDGALGGVLPNLPPGISDPLFAVVTAEAANLSGLLADPARRMGHLQALLGLATSANYAGLALEYRGLTEADQAGLAALLNDLHIQLQAQNKGLLLLLDLPATAAPAGGLNWGPLGAAVDGLVARLPEDPRALGNGAAAAGLNWATGAVERSRLRLATSAMAVTESEGAVRRVAPSAALAALGATQADGLPAELYPGAAITLTLSGEAQTVAYDAEAAAPRLTTPGATLWLTTPATLRQRFALAEQFRLGGVVAEDVFQTGVSPEALTALAGYRASATAAQEDAASLMWTVRNAEGVVAQATAQPGEPYVFVPEVEGEYQVIAQLQVGGAAQELGAVPLKIAAAPTPTQPVRFQAGNTGGGNTNTSGGGNTSGGNTGGGSSSGGFVPPAPVANGAFELGGQVPGFISHPAQMQQAGMRWVKFQVRGGGGDAIAAGKAAGFKVLLSVIGDKGRVTDPNYWNEYAAWVGGLAGQGADAIEVWNEPNIDHEWPEGQISGATYTQLLAKAYAAIKAANPATLVVSAGPAPTGAEAAFPGKVMNDDKFLAQMAAAGAANYMDCVGTHFNSGTTSPNATTGATLGGYHYSFYFWPMVDTYYNAFGGSRQLCFTELGYLTPEGYGSLPGNFAWAADTSVAEQAQWLAESASLAANSGKVRLMVIWNVDFTVWTGDPQAGYAMIRPGGGCPACSALDAVMP